MRTPTILNASKAPPFADTFIKLCYFCNESSLSANFISAYFMSHSNHRLLNVFLFTAFLLALPFLGHAQQVTRINPDHITLRGVSLSSFWTGIIVGDSNYAAITHSAYDLATSPSFTALQSPFAHSTTLYAVAYAGDTSHAVIAGANGSLAWTSNDGATWTPYALGTTATIRAVTWNSSAAAPVLVGVGDGGLVIRSTDQGQSWKTIKSPTARQLNAIAFGSATEAVAVGNDTTMIQSHDGGQTWSPMAFPYNFHTWDTGFYENKMGTINFTGVAMGGKDSVWVCFDTAMAPLLVCQGGAADTSEEFLDQLFGQGYLPIVFPPQTYPAYTSVLYVGVPNVCLTSTSNVGDFVYYTINCDSNISEFPLPAAGDVNGIQVNLPLRIRAQGLWKQDTNFVILWVGDDLSLYEEYWTGRGGIKFNRGFPPYPSKETFVDFLGVSTLPNGYGYTAAQGDQFLRTRDSGKTWTYVTLPIVKDDSAIDGVFTLDSATAVIAGYSGVILRYDTTGFHFLPSGTSERLESIAFPSQDTGIIVGDFGTVLQSADRGETWKSISGVPTTGRLFSVAFANDNVGIAVGDSATILRTTDEGETWAIVNNLLTGTNMTLTNVQGFYDGTFFIHAGNQLLRSTDFGQNWVSILPNGMSDISGMSFYSPQIGMIAEPSTSSQYIPDTAHLAYTLDGGSSWSPFSFPFWNQNLIIMNWVRDHEAVIYGTFGFIDDIVISTSGVQVTRMDNASTAQAFPNPFTDKTTVTISPTESGMASVTVVNLLGQEVAKLYDGNLSAGQHSFTWDASGVAAGTYNCVVEMNGKVETVPVVKR
jgi:photosystem II stability/assembly factor-like uncharacterized protein